MNTYFGLLAEFETTEIQLRDVCEKYLGMDYKTACYHASKQSLPFPVYRAGSQKSPLLVSAEWLAKYIKHNNEEKAIQERPMRQKAAAAQDSRLRKLLLKKPNAGMGKQSKN